MAYPASAECTSIITLTTCISVISDFVVRRILNAHYTLGTGGDGPSWLTFLGHTKDSRWSADLFRCESILLQTHWVPVIMDQYTRCIVGFGIHASDVDGVTLCCIFNGAISKQGLPRFLSSDNDPLFRYHRWQANLRLLEVEEIKSIPYTPISHPFIERMIVNHVVERSGGNILIDCFLECTRSGAKTRVIRSALQSTSGSPIAGW